MWQDFVKEHPQNRRNIDELTATDIAVWVSGWIKGARI